MIYFRYETYNHEQRILNEDLLDIKNNVEILILFILGTTTFGLFEAFGPAVTAVSIFLYPVFYFLLKTKEA